MSSASVSPLTEANGNSLDEYFSRKPPYDAQTLAAIKTKFRRLRAKFGEDQAAGKTTKAKKTSAKTTEVTMDIFGARDSEMSKELAAYNDRLTMALAKQVAIFNGQNFERLDQKNRAALMTLANSLLSTINRLGNSR